MDIREEPADVLVSKEFNKITEKDDKAFCVIGRPIYQSENPLESLKKIVS